MRRLIVRQLRRTRAGSVFVDVAKRLLRQGQGHPSQGASQDGVRFAIETSWSNDYTVGLQGWIFGTNGPVEDAAVTVNGVRVPVTAWCPRRDVATAYARYGVPEQCGFTVLVPRSAEHDAVLDFTYRGRRERRSIRVRGAKPPAPAFEDARNSIVEFARRVNDGRLHVLEVGSRVVSPGSVSKRGFFPLASSYTGFDLYPDANTDVVGDAHRLFDYFAPRRFGAIFSMSVLEHLAMPWVVAREVNRLLELGGITFHATHFAWPRHEEPWDFWRFSDEGLKVLFSRALGFEVIQAGLIAPLRMHLDAPADGQEMFPISPGFAGAAILARKVAEVDAKRFAWDAGIEEILESRYPAPAGAHPMMTATPPSSQSSDC